MNNLEVEYVDINARILSKIVNLENKRNGENTRQYLRDNNLNLRQDYENVQRTENITYFGFNLFTMRIVSYISDDLVPLPSSAPACCPASEIS